MAGTATELWRLTARQAVDLLRRGKVSPAELIDASETRVAATDGALNAMPTLCFDRARARIGGLERLDKAHPGWLGGLPIGVKDLNDVEGVKTTFGSPIYKDNVSTKTDLGVRGGCKHRRGKHGHRHQGLNAHGDGQRPDYAIHETRSATEVTEHTEMEGQKTLSDAVERMTSTTTVIDPYLCALCVLCGSAFQGFDDCSSA